MCYKSFANELLSRAGHRCQCCGIPGDLAELGLDHIIPQSKDGNDEVGNLQVLCGACNNLKADHLVPGFATWSTLDNTLTVAELIDQVKQSRENLAGYVRVLKDQAKETKLKNDIQRAMTLLKAGKRGSTVRNIFKRERMGEARISSVIKQARAALPK